MLADKDSWWRSNLTALLGGRRGRFVNLHGLAHRDAAKRIAAGVSMSPLSLSELSLARTLVLSGCREGR